MGSDRVWLPVDTVGEAAVVDALEEAAPLEDAVESTDGDSRGDATCEFGED